MRLFHVIWFLPIFSTYVECYKILGLFPYPGKSHLDVILPLMKELSRRGHEVVVVSQYPLETPMPRYTDISLKGSIPPMVDILTVDTSNPLKSRLMNKYLSVYLFGKFADVYCEAALAADSVTKLMKSDEIFDIIFHEPFMSDCLLALNEKFKAPIVSITTSMMLPWNNERFGNPDNPSYIPTLWLDYSNKMEFLERVENFLVHTAHKFWFKMKQQNQNSIIRTYLGENHPPLSLYGNNMSLLLVNTHFSLSFARPFSPNVIEVGGLHISKPKALPKVRAS